MEEQIIYHHFLGISGLYTGFLPRGDELGVCQKEEWEAVGRECKAVRSCRAAAGRWVQEGMCPLPHNIDIILS